jgi:DNA-binding response OmpR family regulator
MSKHILIVDDDDLVRRSLTVSLTQAGYATAAAGSAEEALALIRVQRPDLILLDIGLPGMDGLEALRAIRRRFGDTPVIFVTARRRELDEIVGMESGADDYITKPYNLDVLLAHIRAVLRRSAAAAPIEPGEVVAGDLRIDPAAHTATVAGRQLELTPRLFDLLTVFARNAERVLSPEDLLQQVWGAEWIGEPQTLYVHIRWLREQLEEDAANPRRLITVRGVGYKYMPVN